jgi:hypothetical protein
MVGILSITIGASEVTSGKSYEHAGFAGIGRFTLYAVKYLIHSQCHLLTNPSACGLISFRPFPSPWIFFNIIMAFLTEGLGIYVTTPVTPEIKSPAGFA